jgi:PAS domain S-box-containing protein
MFKADMAGVIIDWNTQLARVSGVPAGEVVGRPLIELVRPDGREAVVPCLAKALQGQMSRDVSVSLMLDRGWQVTLLLGLSPRYDGGGERIVGVLGLAQVLTAVSPAPVLGAAGAGTSAHAGVASDAVGHHGVSDTLEAHELRELIDAAAVPLMSVDTRGRVEAYNKRMATLSGAAATEVIDATLWKAAPFSAGDTASLLRSAFERALSGEHVIGVDLVIRTSRGTGAALQINASPIYSRRDDGACCGDGSSSVAGSDSSSGGTRFTKVVRGVVFVGVLDPLHQRSMEQAQLTRSLLVQGEGSERRGPRVDLASLSHDLRTPLNGMLGSLELALQQPMSAPIQVPLRHAMTSGNHLLDLVNDLLALHGTVELERQRFNLRELLEEHSKACAVQAREKSVRFQWTVGKCVPKHVLGDRRRLLQVINHLTANALRSTSRGEISISAEVVHETQGAIKLQLVVIDTGVGVQQEVLDEATAVLLHEDAEKAIELSSWRNARAVGRTAALGIAICHQLLSSMGGSLMVKSTYGEGSRVEAMCLLEKTYSNTVIERRNSRESVASEVSEQSEKDARVPCPFEFKAGGTRNAEPEGKAGAGGTSSTDEDVSSSTHSQCQHLGKVKGGGIDVDTDRSTHSNETDEVSVGRGAVDDDGEAQRRFEVLVVEDNDLNAWVVCSMLQGRGHLVRHVPDGSAAVELVGYTLRHADAPRIDLILMDCSMPIVDGYTATALIRYLEAGELEGAAAAGAAAAGLRSCTTSGMSVPIIALTAFAMAADRVKCLEAGMDDYMTKPVGKSSLLKLVDRYRRAGLGLGGAAPSSQLQSDANQLLPARGGLRPHLPYVLSFRERLCEIALSMRRAASQGLFKAVIDEAEQLSQLCVLPELDEVRQAADGIAKLTVSAGGGEGEVCGAIGGDAATSNAEAVGRLSAEGGSLASLTLQVDAAVSMLSVMLGSLGVERSSVGVNSSASVNNSAGVNSSAGVKAPPARLVSTTAPAAQDASASGVAARGVSKTAAPPLLHPPAASAPTGPRSSQSAFTAAAPTMELLAAVGAACSTPEPQPPPPEAPPPHDAKSILDPKKMLEEIGGERTTMLRLLAKFADHAKPTIDGLRRAADAREWSTVRREAHSLKGSSGYVASESLRSAALALQKAAEEALTGPEHEAPVPALVNRVASEMELVLAAIHNELQGSALNAAQGASAVPTVNPRAGNFNGAPAAGSGAAGDSGAAAVVPRAPTPPMAPAAVSSVPPSVPPATQAATSVEPAASISPAASAVPAVPTFPAAPLAAPLVAPVPADHSSDPEAVLDWTRALANFGGDAAILHRLLTKFEERAKPCMDKIRRAAQGGDLSTLQREAHSLKGAAGYIGAGHLQQAAVAFEQQVDQAVNEPSTEQSLMRSPTGRFDAAIERIADEQRRVLVVIAARLRPS